MFCKHNAFQVQYQMLINTCVLITRTRVPLFTKSVHTNTSDRLVTTSAGHLTVVGVVCTRQAFNQTPIERRNVHLSSYDSECRSKACLRIQRKCHQRSFCDKFCKNNNNKGGFRELAC